MASSESCQIEEHCWVKGVLGPRETKYLKLHKISDEHEVENVTNHFEEVMADTILTPMRNKLKH